ncbi:YicC/YloC family endoribonuclease [Rurimicrobium arvi]|uniref:YicC family protein n=1 Tax=Rurimicrobium arvi TaxID=2049916 RepID=A0ABP8MWC0_9BACT
MLYSMTGFGRAEAVLGAFQVLAEVKSLNGKQSDINTRISPLLRPYEHEIRSLVNNRLTRGTIDLTMTVKQDGVAKPMSINVPLAVNYYQGMKAIAEQLGLPTENVLATLMSLPEVVAADQEMLSEEDWLAIKNVLEQALKNLSLHREKEGVVLEADLLSCISAIEKGLQEILPFEPVRMEKLRSKMLNGLEEMVGVANVDKNRFEQELIYYIEKIDFSEEKVRLTQHCNYFREIIAGKDEVKGKKLGFVLQEVGREINTLGSKANDASIQKIIVGMKDYLEKAKEQVLNVL